MPDLPSHHAAPAEAATRTFPPHANAEPSYADLRAAGMKSRCVPSAGLAAANGKSTGRWAEWIERYGGRKDVT